MNASEDFLVAEPTDQRTTYRGYVITYDPPPIPDRRWDWHFQHKEFDGAPDGGDHRYGEAASVTDCMNEIDQQVDGGDNAHDELVAALTLIASHAGKTLISVEHGQPYSIGANAAFEQLAGIAADALAKAAPVTA